MHTMKSFPLSILTAFILCSISITPVEAGWFGPEHYYRVNGGFYCKGKPYQDGDFTVMILYPTGREYRLKTSLVYMIEDLGTTLPEGKDG